MNAGLRLCSVTIGLLTAGCGVEHLPAPAAPAKVVPEDVDMPPEPPAAGMGRILLDANGERAKVVEVTGSATASNGRYSATIVGIRPLCTTPCVVDLPYGTHPIVLQSTTDETHRSEADLEVTARAKVFRHALGERRDGGAAQAIGTTVLTLGLVAATTGALLWGLGSANSGGASLVEKGQLITGLGAGGIVLSIPFLVVGRSTERPGATTQWALPGSAPPPSLTPQAPMGAALDRL